MSIDLHVHSKNSDGSLSKEEIIDIALNQQLEAISITDHEYLTEVDVNEKIEIIPGVEISVNWHELDIANKYSGTHLLVYFITENSSLNKHLEVLRTRKISLNGYNIHNGWSYFCSQGCWNDFFHKYASQCINIAPRHEPLETPIERVEKTTHTTNWGHTYTNTRIITVDNNSG